MNERQDKKRAYSPHPVDRMRKDGASSDVFKDLVETDVVAGEEPGPRTKKKPGQAVSGLSDKDVQERRKARGRYAAARRKAKTRGGKLLFD